MTVSKIKYPFVSYGIISINLLIFLLQFFSGDSSLDPLIALKWGANFAPLTLGHDWWRLITSMFVHYGIFHLLVNMFSLYQIGRKLEKDIGAAGLLFVYFTTGLLGGLLSLYWNLFVFSAGASGAIFGLFGFEVASELIRNKDDLKRIRFILINFFIYISVIFFLGTQFPFDNAAHLGGLVFGVVIAFLYRYFTRWAFPIKVASLLTTVILILIGYYYMPRYQKTYFEIGQKALFTEKRANQISDGDYTSDAVFVKDMKTLSPSWDSVLFSLDSLKNIPAGLAEDKVTLYKYAELKGLEIDYMATCIDQERYIYFDSLDIVREAMRNMPRAKYVFNLTPQPKDTLPNQELDSPKEVVKEYYDSIWRPSSAWNAKYYRIGYQDSLGTWVGLARDYYLNGNVQMRGGYENGLRDGVFIYYSEDNQYEAAGIYR
ncbi:MAG: rhomboid family intramembrane serine protease, partial [Bacteroidota bacterium]